MVGFRQVKLDSGLSVVLAPMATESVTVLGMVRVGSRDEVEGQFGGAHFLEHMVFKGTGKYPAVGDIAKAVEGVGGVQNAFTSTEQTSFFVKVPARQKDLAVKVVGQMMNEPLLDKVEFEKEKGTIIEEIRMYEDWNPRVAEEKFDELVYKGTSLERPIAGSVESVEKMKIEALKSFHDGWYLGDNTVVVVAGKLGNEEKLIKKIEEEFRTVTAKGRWKDERKKERRRVMKESRVKVVKKESEQVNIVMGVNWFETCNRRRSAVAVMSHILGGGMTSRLWKEIREKRGLAYYIRSGVDLGKDDGAVAVMGGIRKGKEEEAMKIIKEEMFKFSQEMVSEEELKRAKESLKGKMMLGLETSDKVAEVLASDWVMRKGKLRKFEDRIKGIEKVSGEKVLEVAREMFKKKHWCLSVVGSFDEKKKEEELKKVLKS